jgi:heme/copper-type cytochrome/quinol oxidase subunit 2
LSREGIRWWFTTLMIVVVALVVGIVSIMVIVFRER